MNYIISLADRILLQTSSSQILRVPSAGTEMKIGNAKEGGQPAKVGPLQGRKWEVAHQDTSHEALGKKKG